MRKDFPHKKSIKDINVYNQNFVYLQIVYRSNGVS